MDVKKTQESGAVVLENLPDDVKHDVLNLLVENISRLPENDFIMELIPELRKAVVTFKIPMVNSTLKYPFICMFYHNLNMFYMFSFFGSKVNLA